MISGHHFSRPIRSLLCLGIITFNEELSLHEESSSDHEQSVDDQTVGPVLEHTSESARKYSIPVGQEDLKLIQATIKDRQNLPNFGDQLLLLKGDWTLLAQHSSSWAHSIQSINCRGI